MRSCGGHLLPCVWAESACLNLMICFWTQTSQSILKIDERWGPYELWCLLWSRGNPFSFLLDPQVKINLYNSGSTQFELLLDRGPWSSFVQDPEFQFQWQRVFLSDVENQSLRKNKKCWLIIRQCYEITSGGIMNDITTPQGSQHQPCWMAPGSSVALDHLRQGFGQAVLGVLRLRPDAVMTCGPPCGSFIWINSGTHQRSADSPYGDETKDYVNIASMNLDSKTELFLNMGEFWKKFIPGFYRLWFVKPLLFSPATNFASIQTGGYNSFWKHVRLEIMIASTLPSRIAARTLMLVILATVRGAYATIEQPASSTMKYLPDFVRTGKLIQKLLGLWTEQFLWGNLASFSHKKLIVLKIALHSCPVGWPLGDLPRQSLPDFGEPRMALSVGSHSSWFGFGVPPACSKDMVQGFVQNPDQAS